MPSAGRRSTPLLFLALACGAGGGSDTAILPSAPASPMSPAVVVPEAAPVAPEATPETIRAAALSCGVPASSPLVFACRTCLDAPVRRCIEAAVPAAESTSPACAVPSCELELPELAPSDIRPSPGGAYYSNPDESESLLQGSCADGKTFRAVLGPVVGRVLYFRDETASAVGVAEYTAQIGKCECSGESWAGDAACPGATFEIVDGAVPSGEVRFPFADGRRLSPCACLD